MNRQILVLLCVGCGLGAGCLELHAPDSAGGAGGADTWGSITSSGVGGVGASSSSGMGGIGGMGASGSSSSSGVGASGSSSSSSSSGMGGGICGNGKIETGEMCDDGNKVNGDGCDAKCLLEKNSSLFIGMPGQAGTADGSGTSARLTTKLALAISSSNLFVADGSTVRMVDIPTATIKTIAGIPASTSYMDSAIGLNARFRALSAITTDGSTVWVADTANYVLRSISLEPSNAVKTVAGSVFPFHKDGTGSGASFDDIRGLAYHNGFVYIVDAKVAVLRSFNVATSEVKTLAGTPYELGNVDGIGAQARFTNPLHIASDGAGALYIADADGYQIRKYDIATKAVTTIAGNGTCGYVDGLSSSARVHQVRGLTFDGNILYWAESTAHTIRAVVNSGFVGTISGTTPGCLADCGCSVAGGYAEGPGSVAKWKTPYDVAYHAASKALFVSDSGNYVIRRLE